MDHKQDLDVAFIVSGDDYRLNYLQLIPNKDPTGNSYPYPLINQSKKREIPFSVTMEISGSTRRFWMIDYFLDYLKNIRNYQFKDHLTYFIILFLDFEDPIKENSNNNIISVIRDFIQKFDLKTKIMIFHTGMDPIQISVWNKFSKDSNMQIIINHLKNSNNDIQSFIQQLGMFLEKQI